ncbi:glutaredoxin family protein [Marinobacter fonticola]|uniref:glutaredoxin family protein n=1 Tax=Marinobacter fonticola TaxID=2603215 RepID=UPI0011E6C77C|nr:thioredoxin family protein [Marinobacter fonticola]
MSTVIELFSAPHCGHCSATAERLRSWLANRGFEIQEYNILDHIDRAVDLGIQRAPALVLDGAVIHQGPIGNQRLRQLFGEPLCLK